MEEDEVEKYWNYVALEAQDFEKTMRLEAWKKVARNWLAHYTEKKARDFIIQTVENHVKLKSEAQILDVGCGPGKWVNLFAERGFIVTGIDSSPWMIRLAKKRVRKDEKNLSASM